MEPDAVEVIRSCNSPISVPSVGWYPTADGMIDTIAWEGFREGVDDVRYATTLTLQIAAAMAGKDPERTRVAGEAQQYLNEFEVSGDLDEIRSSIIGYILKLRGVE